MTETSMQVSLPGGPTFPRLGYGAMRLTGQPRNFGPYRDTTAGIALLRRAYARGVGSESRRHRRSRPVYRDIPL